MQQKLLIVAISITLLTSCSTLQKSMLTGGAIGAGAGLVGSVAGNYDGRSTAIITATTTIGGALLGLIVHKIVEHNNQSDKDLGSKKKLIPKDTNDEVPSLSTPEVRRIWVPDSIEGENFIKGHWKYVIEKQSEWRNSDDKE